jgi:chemotaxis protein CheC
VDVLRELGNIGSGNAAAALSDMTQSNVKIKVPKVSILKFNEVVDFFGSAEKIAAGLLIDIRDDIEGKILYVFGDDFVNAVQMSLIGMSVENLIEMDEMQKSALLEIGNIMAASYVNAISQMTSLTIDISIPSLAIDMVGALLAVPVIEYGNLGDSVLFIDDCFTINGKEVEANMILIPTIDSLNVMFKKLGVDA